MSSSRDTEMDDGSSEVVKENLPLGSELGGGDDRPEPSKSRKRKRKEFITPKREKPVKPVKPVKRVKKVKQVKQEKKENKLKPSKTRKEKKLKPSKTEDWRTDPVWTIKEPWTIQDQMEEDRQLFEQELDELDGFHDALRMSFCMIARADMAEEEAYMNKDASSERFVAFDEEYATPPMPRTPSFEDFPELIADPEPSASCPPDITPEEDFGSEEEFVPVYCTSEEDEAASEDSDGEEQVSSDALCTSGVGLDGEEQVGLGTVCTADAAGKLGEDSDGEEQVPAGAECASGVKLGGEEQVGSAVCTADAAGKLGEDSDGKEQVPPLPKKKKRAGPSRC